MSCQDIVEMVTDYVEGIMPKRERRRFEEHLSICAGCVTYVAQIRETIQASGELPREETLPPELREGLLAEFRDWSRKG